MNRIILSGEDDIKNIVIDIDTELIIKNDSVSKELNIILEDNICLRVLELSKNSKDNFIFDLNENSRLIYDKIGQNPNDRIVVNLNGVSSNVEIRNSVTNKIDSCCKFEIRHNASKTTSRLVNHGVNNSLHKLNFKVDAYIPCSAIDCITNQENKIINNKSGKSIILPNLIIDTDRVEANHSAFIGDFDNNIMFYLRSRGIDIKTAKNLLINGFLVGNVTFDEQFKNDVEEILKI